MTKIRVQRDALPAPEVHIRNAIAAYRAALEAHKSTVGVPAPLPQFDIVFELARYDELEVFDPPREALGDVDTFKQAVDRMVAGFNALQDEVTKLKFEIASYKDEVAKRNAQEVALGHRLDLIDTRVANLKLNTPR